MRNFTFLCITLILCSTFLATSQTLAQESESPREKIKQLKSTPDFNSQSTTYIDLLIVLAKANIRSDSTAIVIKEAYDLSMSANYVNGQCNALAMYGYHYAVKGKAKKAYDANMMALKVATTNNYNDGKIRALNNMGLDFWDQGEDEKALTLYLDALAIGNNATQNILSFNINNNIAILYDDNEDDETALIFYEKARKYSIIENNKLALGAILINMAGIYNLKDSLEKASEKINLGIEIFKKLKNKEWLSNAYAIKGDITLKNKNNNEALKWYTKSEKLSDELNYSRGHAISYQGIAWAHLGLKNLETAEEYAIKGLQVSEKFNISKVREDYYLLLSEIYNAKGLHKKAYKYLTDYNEQYEKRSKEGFKKGHGLLRSKMKFENQKKALIEENNKALAEQKRYIYLALTALLIVSLFLILIFRTQKIQKKFTAQLSDSNATKDKLFSVIAHDLKGPINSFYSLMKLSMEPSVNKEETEHLFPKAMADIHNISDMLNNLLLWAKTQIQGTTIKQQNIDINKIAHDNLLLLSPLAEKKNIKLINSIPKSTISFSDRDHIDIVLRNLISNAIKFTKSNGQISLNATEMDIKLQIQVCDSGVGMDLETKSKLFEKNNTTSTYGTNNEKGTGLGLALCKDMVESNGGNIWVSSAKDKGTTIYFTLPTKQEYLKAI